MVIPHVGDLLIHQHALQGLTQALAHALGQLFAQIVKGHRADVQLQGVDVPGLRGRAQRIEAILQLLHQPFVAKAADEVLQLSHLGLAVEAALPGAARDSVLAIHNAWPPGVAGALAAGVAGVSWLSSPRNSAEANCSTCGCLKLLLRFT